MLQKFAEIEASESEYDRTLIDDVFEGFIEFVQSKLKEYCILRVDVPAGFLFSEYNIEPEFRNDIKFQNEIEIEQSRVIRDSDNNALEIEVANGNAHIESPEGETVCKEGLTAKDIIYFVRNASEEIEKTISKYRISKEDQEKLYSIKIALS